MFKSRLSAEVKGTNPVAQTDRVPQLKTNKSMHIHVKQADNGGYSVTHDAIDNRGNTTTMHNVFEDHKSLVSGIHGAMTSHFGKGMDMKTNLRTRDTANY